jgi:uncharacterized membrane protein
MMGWFSGCFTSGGSANTSLQTSGGAQPSPREILDIRYASGEIDRDLYQQMLSDLN